jgi:CubicO group peptidase (beta-lactamase class C family)
MRFSSLLPLWICVAAHATAAAQSVTVRSASDTDRALVRQAALDYVLAFYEGDTLRLQRSVRPDLAKYGFWRDSNGTYAGENMSFAEAVTYTARVKARQRPIPPEWPRDVEVFDVGERIAAAKVYAWWGVDDLLLRKNDGHWMVQDVLWEGPPRIDVVSDTVVFRQLMDSAVRVGMPGLQVSVRIGGRRWMGAGGYASLESRRAMTLRDRVRLASLTKMLTYAATMELVKARRIRLSDRAMNYLDAGFLAGVPNAQDITIGQLLEHTSGLHNFNGEAGQDFFAELYSETNWGRRQWTPAELVAFARRPANRPTGRPGELRSYSSTGYIVLGAVIERVTGRPFQNALRDLVLEPLGMSRAVIDGSVGTDSIVDSYAVASPDDLLRPSPMKGRQPVRPDGLLNLSKGLAYYNAWAGAAGAVAATVSDLDAFMQAVRDNRRTVLNDQRQVFLDAQPRTSFSWNGGTFGIQTSILYAPVGDITVIVLGNGTNVNVSTMDLAKRYLEEARRHLR